MHLKSISWENIAEYVFQNYQPGSNENKYVTDLFAKLWSSLADEFVSISQRNECNSIKHGFRVQLGGFEIKMAVHDIDSDIKDEKMQTVGKSKYGVSYYKLQKINSDKTERSYRIERYCVNWDMQKTIDILKLVSISITNIISALQILNKTEVEVNFIIPERDFNFTELFSDSIGGSQFSIGPIINDRHKIHVNKDKSPKSVVDYNEKTK